MLGGMSCSDVRGLQGLRDSIEGNDDESKN
jgi:hypothetical protein